MGRRPYMDVRIFNTHTVRHITFGGGMLRNLIPTQYIQNFRRRDVVSRERYEYQG